MYKTANQVSMDAIIKVQDDINEQFKKASKQLTRIASLLKKRRHLLDQHHTNTGTPITQAYDDKPLIAGIQTLLNFYVELDHKSAPYQCQCAMCLTNSTTTTPSNTRATLSPIHVLPESVEPVEQDMIELASQAQIELDTKEQQDLINDINKRRDKMMQDQNIMTNNVTIDKKPLRVVTNAISIDDIPTQTLMPSVRCDVSVDNEYEQHRKRMLAAQQDLLKELEKKEQDQGTLYSIPFKVNNSGAENKENNENNDNKVSDNKDNDQVKDKLHKLGPVFANDLQADLMREFYNDANDLITAEETDTMQQALEQAKSIENAVQQMAQREIDKPLRNHLGVYEVDPAPINALTRLTQRERDKLTYIIFQKAKVNIRDAIQGKEQDFTEEQIDKLVSDEADRLLTLYIKTH